MKSINIKIFFGYQLQSNYHHSKNDFEKLGIELQNRLSKIRPKVRAQIEYCEFPLGRQLWNEILKTISKSDITIFDISENNPNVLLEVGISFGLGKFVILLKNKSSDDSYHTPTDLKSFIFLSYSSITEICSEININKIIEPIHHYIEMEQSPLFYYHSFWNLNPNSRTIIVCSKLPLDRNKINFEDYVRLRLHGDLDALFFTVQTICRLYPSMDLVISGAEKLNDLPEGWESDNLILIGGPDVNPLVNQFDKYSPIQYGYGPGENDIYLIIKDTKEEKHPQFDEQNNKKSALDFGFFLKRKLRKDGQNKLIILGGAHTWGTLAAIKLFSCTSYWKNSEGYKNSKQIIKTFGSDPSFWYVFKVQGTIDGMQVPQLNVDDIKQINEK